MTTGNSILEYHKKEKVARDFQIKKIGLNLPRPELYARINQRVDQMMEYGLLEEVKSMQAWRHLNALQTVGYTELFNYLDGETSLERAVELIKQNTRHYAKRQLTWFQKENDTEWFDPADSGGIIATAKK